MSNIKPWENKNILSANHAKEIINNNFPKICIKSIKLLGEGWDNTTWIINDNLCFRFPKHEEAAKLLTNEIKVLSQLIKTNISLPIPKNVCLAPKSFNYPFYYHDYINGVTSDRANLTSNERMLLVVKLASFLKELHSFPLDKCISLGIEYDQINRLNFKDRYLEFKERLEYLINRNVLSNDLNIKKFYESNMDISIPDFATLCHGDLYAKHLIIDSNKDLHGIIDWGDSGLLHPAIDLAIVYQFLPKKAHSLFWSVYGDVENHTHTIAILRAIYSSTTIAWYAHQISDKYLFDEGILGLQMINEIIS
ncbi:aminoglycoside phosphotransferase family protein [Pseudofrancisella aestuarii]|uniref:Aminoglycoside phosphotransferase family protein n=1 Tax=Pseudofrancisella aestuarii TaxID=2670347 RepID=A0ABV9T9Y4_9GAMM|nr:aminoglycoside phosphotransferase family protein [Pseudofrancisella aestuarii]